MIRSQLLAILYPLDILCGAYWSQKNLMKRKKDLWNIFVASGRTVEWGLEWLLGKYLKSCTSLKTLIDFSDCILLVGMDTEYRKKIRASRHFPMNHTLASDKLCWRIDFLSISDFLQCVVHLQLRAWCANITIFQASSTSKFQEYWKLSNLCCTFMYV